MKMVMISIYDQASGCFSRPVYVRSEGEGIRSFLDEVVKAESPPGVSNPMASHPEHFSLWFVGKFDDADCKIEQPSTGPFELAKAIQALQPKP